MADNRIPSSEFRTTYSSLSEPVEVTVLGRVIGTYYPKGTGPAVEGMDGIRDLVREKDVEIKYLKSELAKRLTTKVTGPVETFAPKTAVRAMARYGSFGHSTPAPKGT